LIDGEPAGDLQVQEDGTLTGSFTVERRGLYSIELARDNGALVPASPEYTIDLLTDQEPSLRFTRPGRDMPASPIEEVYLEMEAFDDYGVRDVRLVYSVNGGPEDTVAVFGTSGPPLREVSAGHTLYLEEWQLEPGDLVSYYGLVRDNGNGALVASDMFVLNVRPFERAYREAEQQGGGGGRRRARLGGGRRGGGGAGGGGAGGGGGRRGGARGEGAARLADGAPPPPPAPPPPGAGPPPHPPRRTGLRRRCNPLA